MFFLEKAEPKKVGQLVVRINPTSKKHFRWEVGIVNLVVAKREDRLKQVKGAGRCGVLSTWSITGWRRVERKEEKKTTNQRRRHDKKKKKYVDQFRWNSFRRMRSRIPRENGGHSQTEGKFVLNQEKEGHVTRLWHDEWVQETAGGIFVLRGRGYYYTLRETCSTDTNSPLPFAAEEMKPKNLSSVFFYFGFVGSIPTDEGPEVSVIGERSDTWRCAVVIIVCVEHSSYFWQICFRPEGRKPPFRRW